MTQMFTLHVPANAGRRTIISATSLPPDWVPVIELTHEEITYRFGETTRDFDGVITGWRYHSARGDILFVSYD